MKSADVWPYTELGEAQLMTGSEEKKTLIQLCPGESKYNKLPSCIILTFLTAGFIFSPSLAVG